MRSGRTLPAERTQPAERTVHGRAFAIPNARLRSALIAKTITLASLDAQFNAWMRVPEQAKAGNVTLNGFLATKMMFYVLTPMTACTRTPLNHTCTCPDFLQYHACKHAIHFSMASGVLQLPDEYKSVRFIACSSRYRLSVHT